MSKTDPLIAKGRGSARTKASIFYGADEYLEELKKKYAHDHEINNLQASMPDGGHSHAPEAAGSKEKLLSVDKDKHDRSKKTGRLFPESNKPDPMPQELQFLFTRVSPEQMMYMWNVLMMIHIVQWCLIIYYACMRYFLPDLYWFSTLSFGIIFSYVCIQNIYIDHDVMHGATFPPYNFQKFLTHCFADFISLPWEEFVLEHNRHHASTVDLLIQGEFGWDPEEYHYMLQQWTDGPGLLLTVPLIPIVHFFGLNDTGSLFSIEWYLHFPDAGPGGKCNKEFWSKWVPRRLKHNSFTLSVWAMIFLIGYLATNQNAGEGFRFMLTVSMFARIGFGLAWMFITNFTHSLPWNRFLANDPDRTFPCLHSFMALILGGRHRWNEMLFHDVHHAFPNAVGTLSQRGRFHGWRKVHDAAVEVLHRGIWKAKGDMETEMEKQQKKRSMLMKSGRKK